MPEKFSFPGVYVEDVPSRMRVIAGVSTAIAAFVGWAPRGPAGRPVRCRSWSDFQRAFGGLDARGYLGYAVMHFFGNGGGECHVIRLAGAGDVVAKADIDGLEVEATGPGTWANAYRLATRPRTTDASRFDLDVIDTASGAILETYADLSLDPADGRFVTNVVGNDSQWIGVSGVDATNPVTATTKPLEGGRDGAVLMPDDAAFGIALIGDGAATGIYALRQVDLFNMLNVPGYTDAATLATLARFCRDRRALLLVDPDAGRAMTGAPDSRLTGDDGINAALYYPWILAPDPQAGGRVRAFPPCGAVAGVYARTDATRGVWKAPAGTDATLIGVNGVALTMSDAENRVLAPLGVNCIRSLAALGTIVWGARTLRGDDALGSAWKYVPVRRTALFIEESVARGLQWAVFAPNDEHLWSQIRLSIGAFMNDLFRQRAFPGTSPKDAYFVRCDQQTTTQDDINRGLVTVQVGFAPLRPAEFIVLTLRQSAGQPVA